MESRIFRTPAPKRRSGTAVTTPAAGEERGGVRVVAEAERPLAPRQASQASAAGRRMTTSAVRPVSESTATRFRMRP